MNLIKKFKPAFSGLKLALNDSSIRLQCYIAIGVLLVAIVARLDAICWLGLSSAIAMVIITETINTTIERMCDLIQPELDPRIRYIKDLSAGFVLMASLYALCIAIWIIIHTWF